MKHKGYKINFKVDDDGKVTFTGEIDTKAYKNKATEQIWTAMYNATRQLIVAWETNNE